MDSAPRVSRFIPDADRSPHSEASWQGTVPESELRRLLVAMRGAGGWRAALDSADLPTARNKREWFMDRRKGSFYASLPVARNGLAVDVGAGSGVIAASLASRFAEVIALERSARWCQFMKERFTQDCVGNVRVICGNGLEAPLLSSSADLVVVNGVLEWVPESDPSRSPRDAQLSFLKRARDLLSPGGVIAVAIENRFHFRHFLGSSPHGELPWVTVFPRPLANWITLRKRGTPYRTWIYGIRGYRRLMRDAGFPEVNVFQVLPSYHQPELVASVWDGESALRFCESRRASRRAVFVTLARLRVLGALSHSFYVVSRR